MSRDDTLMAIAVFAVAFYSALGCYVTWRRIQYRKEQNRISERTAFLSSPDGQRYSEALLDLDREFPA